MKKVPCFLATIISILAWSGCSKDKDDKPGNYVKYDGGQFEIGKVYVQEEDAEFEDHHFADLYIVSKDAKVEVATQDFGFIYQYVNPVESKGTLFFAQIFNDELPISTNLGTIIKTSTFRAEDDILEDPIIDQNSYYFGGVIPIFTEEDNMDWKGSGKEINDGTIDFNKNGDEYEITIQCKDQNGKSITGYYKGSITFLNPDLAK